MPALVALFLSRKNILLDDSTFTALVERLKTYRWAGNIRQLFKGLDAWLLNCELDALPLTADNFSLLGDSRQQNPLTGVPVMDLRTSTKPFNRIGISMN
jgi:two-component system response regulator AtoC/two-component system nitrogen regulation response regulator NtrX